MNKPIALTPELAEQLKEGDKLLIVPRYREFMNFGPEVEVGKRGYYEDGHGERFVELVNSGGWYPYRFVLHPVTAKRLKLTKPAPVVPTLPMTKAVLDLLKQKGTLTSLEAQGVLRCRSLSKRISELKQLGWPIFREMKWDTTGQRYARYSLAL
ncbi:helix-turn-helix domain-containing protein [Brucella pseudogrignonensis]|uniref:helix-turn-helix domain-containing protein n=1 Tax=Brucella pseudogrignonensis TaxID=419475 RepID=UPI000CFBDEC5|nr:helix-turn-helix domain-containing protein [Brucella pseudogrignonensis]MQP38766.1 hypothetical protein [Ochrobactrum sp. MYb237]PQZ43385.1 hypothetical protein CQ059_05495 [Brucella pseudogrignonensis]PRA43132.1 hypothetical protein CQ063_01980 [Brucella pseudogrignonensis]PRA72398.1 hypothetical protein CQ055_03600 [Brucella pseudogrignonensis]